MGLAFGGEQWKSGTDISPQELYNLIQQRNELLAACEKAEYVLSAVAHAGAPTALAQLRSAIAKARQC